jgi:cytochrome c oxidase subunit I+III
VLCAVAYLYLTQNFTAWPPRGTPLPSLVMPSVHMALMLVTLPLVSRVQQQARRFELGPVKRGLVILALLNLAFVLIRCWELLRSLNVKWDTNAYGSAQWLILVMHGTLLLVELVEISGMALIYWTAPAEQKHFSDVYDIAFYYQFMIVIWIPLYVMCFWLPRWL